MQRKRKPSVQTLAVLRAFLARSADWRYGYDLTKEIALPSGTLYPLLVRLADKGLLESAWHPPGKPGMPPRHGYRLTLRGIAFARTVLAAAEGVTVEA